MPEDDIVINASKLHGAIESYREQPTTAGRAEILQRFMNLQATAVTCLIDLPLVYVTNDYDAIDMLDELGG